MKAVIKTSTGLGNIKYMEVEEPKFSSDQILVKVKAAGLCGTDVSLYDWTNTIVEGYNPPTPVIMGHEFAGEVVGVGEDTEGFVVGDRITANPVVSCGNCHLCQQGRANICTNRTLLGLQKNGVFAKYVAIPYEAAYKLPDNISYQIGALSEPLCVVIHALERVPVNPGDVVVIVGAGPLGLLLSLMAQVAGAGRVIVTGLEVDQLRLKVANQLGAEAVNIDTEDLEEKVLEVTKGVGADIVFETAGQPSAVLQSLKVVRRGGKVGLLGIPHALTEINTASLVLGEIDVIGIRAYTPLTWRRCQSIWRVIDTERLKRIVTHTLPLKEVEQGISLIKNRRGIKVLLIPE